MVGAERPVCSASDGQLPGFVVCLVPAVFAGNSEHSMPARSPPMVPQHGKMLAYAVCI